MYNTGKRISFYIIPIEFYVPLGNDKNNILGAETVKVNEKIIQTEIMNKDVIGTWGEIGVVIKLGKRK